MSARPQTESRVVPHGGTLVDRFVAEGHEVAFALQAERLPRITLDARERADLELIATGAVSPLDGFLGSRRLRLASWTGLRLADGTVWPLPLTLAVDDATRDALAVGAAAALYDDAGRLWGVIDVAEIFERDPLAESRGVYGTEDPSHPGVAYLLARPRTLVGGPVDGAAAARDCPSPSTG